MNVADVQIEVCSVANAMIGESPLPDFKIRAKFLFGAVGKTTFDELDCAFESDFRSDQQVKMVGHEDEFVEQIGLASVGEEGFEKKAGPGLGLENGATLPGLRCDEVGLRVVRSVLA